MMRDIEYILKNKIYNITKSTKLYEYVEKEGTGRFINGWEMFRDVAIKIYKALKVIYIKLYIEVEESQLLI